MKNAPEKIYLQIDADSYTPDDFKTLEGVSWSDERIYDNDVAYSKIERNCFCDDNLPIDFVVIITGHDEETILQMLKDWKKWK